MSIYRRLNPRLLVQVGMGLGLLYWANMSNIYLLLAQNHFHLLAQNPSLNLQLNPYNF